MSKTEKPGFYLDHEGNWQPDRRSGVDRRAGGGVRNHEQRRIFRRKADRDLYEKLHKPMIQEALEDFAEEHEKRG